MFKNADWATALDLYIKELEHSKSVTPKAWYDPGAGRQKAQGAIAQLDAARQRLAMIA